MSREREVCPTCKGEWRWEWGVEFTPTTVGPGLPKPWIEWLAGATEPYAQDYTRRWLPDSPGVLVGRRTWLGPVERAGERAS